MYALILLLFPLLYLLNPHLTLFALHAPAADAAKFNGTWVVDFDRTMEEAKKSPKYKVEDFEKLPPIIKRMMAMLTVRITDNAITYVQGDKELSLPYRVESGNEISVVLAVSQDGKDFKLTLSLNDGKFMNLKSSGSDDLDYYIWKRAP